jgi:hypothetical protein
MQKIGKKPGWTVAGYAEELEWMSRSHRALAKRRRKRHRIWRPIRSPGRRKNNALRIVSPREALNAAMIAGGGAMPCLRILSPSAAPAARLRVAHREMVGIEANRIRVPPPGGTAGNRRVARTPGFFNNVR